MVIITGFIIAIRESRFVVLSELPGEHIYPLWPVRLLFQRLRQSMGRHLRRKTPSRRHLLLFNKTWRRITTLFRFCSDSPVAHLSWPSSRFIPFAALPRTAVHSPASALFQPPALCAPSRFPEITCHAAAGQEFSCCQPKAQAVGYLT